MQIKANSVIGIIKCSFSCLDRTMFRTLYISLVHLHLEYSAKIWNPYLKGDMQTLEEKVQRRATKLVPELRDLDYTNRLIALNLPSLLYRSRRMHMDMITVFRIVYGLQGVPFENLFQFHNTITRGNGYKLYKYFCHLNLCKFTFSQLRELIEEWNILPTLIIESIYRCTDF